MGGAVIMAAEAAMRCGAGLVTVVMQPEHQPALLARLPEAMFMSPDSAALEERIKCGRFHRYWSWIRAQWLGRKFIPKPRRRAPRLCLLMLTVCIGSKLWIISLLRSRCL